MQKSEVIRCHNHLKKKKERKKKKSLNLVTFSCFVFRAERKEKEKLHSFEVWLARKEAEDQLRMEQQREEKRRKRLIEEEK